MHYEISGSGIPVVFIHGYCETLNIWRSFESELSKTYQVILVDLPGFGKSDLKTTEFSIKDVADQVKVLLKNLSISKCFMIGHSLGGYVSLAFAEKHPESLLGVGLFHSSVFADSQEKKYIRDKTIQFVAKNGTKAFIDIFIENLFYEGNKGRYSEEIEQMTQEVANTNPNSVMAYTLAMKNRPDNFHIWKTFKQPVFLIAGENDQAVPLIDSQKMIEAISLGEGIILPKTAHMGFIEKKEETLSFVKNFLKKYYS